MSNVLGEQCISSILTYLFVPTRGKATLKLTILKSKADHADGWQLTKGVSPWRKKKIQIVSTILPAICCNLSNALYVKLSACESLLRFN